VLQIRCQSKCHGEVTENSTGIFIKICDSKFCKVQGNEVVEHHFNLEKVNEDGKIYPIKTERFKRPEVRGLSK
jgi:hypothetical protein